MRLLIASDIHGSAHYCRQLAEAFAREGADRMLLLGDILYHGPRNSLPDGYDPQGVADLLNPLAEQLLCVRGNCEADVDQLVLDFPAMADYALLERDGLTIFATHGHLFHPQQPPKCVKGTLLLCGHTHVPAFETYDSFTYVNPGSVSIPKEGSAHGYLVLDEHELTWKTLDGDVWKKERV